jgi:hypothetical protein
MQHRKYSKEILAPLVGVSTSVAGVLRLLGLRFSGGIHALISLRIKEYGLDTGHFTGQGSNRGESHKGGKRKKPFEELLVKRDTGRREHSYVLRRALLESGRPYQCSQCDVGGTWNGKPIMLQVNHLNCDWLDDRISNLEFLCPNCHSQTDGWCGSKGFSRITSDSRRSGGQRSTVITTCAQCADVFQAVKSMTDSRHSYCSPECLAAHRTKALWPTDETLAKLIWQQPATKLALELGISGSALKKHCKLRGIPTPPRGYWQKLQTGIV